MSNKYLEKIAASKKLRKAVHLSMDAMHVSDHVKKKKKLKKVKKTKSVITPRKFARANVKTD